MIHEPNAPLPPADCAGLSRVNDREPPTEGRPVQSPATICSDAVADTLLDGVLRASGSALRHYSMEKTKAEMRAAIRTAVQWGYIKGLKSSQCSCTPLLDDLDTEGGSHD